jgi:hypothetical protein
MTCKLSLGVSRLTAALGYVMGAHFVPLARGQGAGASGKVHVVTLI